jgi:hypothetical protein
MLMIYFSYVHKLVHFLHACCSDVNMALCYVVVRSNDIYQCITSDPDPKVRSVSSKLKLLRHNSLQKKLQLSAIVNEQILTVMSSLCIYKSCDCKVWQSVVGNLHSEYSSKMVSIKRKGRKTRRISCVFSFRLE